MRFMLLLLLPLLRLHKVASRLAYFTLKSEVNYRIFSRSAFAGRKRSFFCVCRCCCPRERSLIEEACERDSLGRGRTLREEISLIDTIVIGQTLKRRNNFQFRPSFRRQNIISIRAEIASAVWQAPPSGSWRWSTARVEKHVDKLHHMKMMNWKNCFIVLLPFVIIWTSFLLEWVPIFGRFIKKK